MKQYSKYKASEVDWLGDFPDSWNITKLKVNAEVQFSSVDRHQYEEERKVSVCHYPDAYKNDKIDSQTPISEGTCTESEYERFQLVEDLVVITKDSESADDIGVPVYIEETIENGVVGYHLALIKSKKDRLFGKYLFRYLQTELASSIFETNANGVTRFGLGKSAIENLYVPQPSIEEQKQIAAYLDHQTGIIDALIAKKELLTQKLKEQRQATINEAVTKGLNPKAPLKDSGIPWLGEIPEHWEVVKLRYLADITTGDKDTENREEEGAYPFFVRSQKVERINSFSYDGEAILTAGDGVGVCKVWHHINGKFDFHQRVYMIYNYRRVIGKYLFFFMKENFIHEVLKLSAKSTVDSLRRPMFQNFPVAVPSFEEQEQIATEIEESESKYLELISNIETQIDKLREYRQSLISEAVTGKIDVREWKPKNN